MSIILFFGSALLVAFVSTVYVVVSIRHLIKNRKNVRSGSNTSLISTPVIEPKEI
jgi:hypothetical protein